ncbi:MAG TPA: DUF72 domain-containing protein, partial [Flavobacteriales bacterium]|jgi:uncharacterized protein YecE (DUF72 family)|nr:DUF72 domain-containing protein [Flavobacteriales bacterium]
VHEATDRTVVIEPRHASWSEPEVNALLRRLHIARVAADPPRGTDLFRVDGARSTAYFRLHGSPRIYWSAYTEEDLQPFAEAIRAAKKGGAEAWVMFDNTAGGHAIPNALRMMQLLGVQR